jgi:hypothetical protein
MDGCIGSYFQKRLSGCALMDVHSVLENAAVGGGTKPGSIFSFIQWLTFAFDRNMRSF